MIAGRLNDLYSPASWGEDYTGLEIIVMVARVIGDSWSDNDWALEIGKITEDEHDRVSVGLIDEVDRYRYRLSIEREIAQLMKEQKEAV